MKPEAGSHVCLCLSWDGLIGQLRNPVLCHASVSDHGSTLSIDFEIVGNFLANKGIHKYRIGKQ